MRKHSMDKVLFICLLDKRFLKLQKERLPYSLGDREQDIDH